ncbi:MAG TPA: Uma2 family endonuclease, partial [Tepidisphaeraceae bacterium]|nr:Uma2 family endonuclease [Tepidisphaeraceae bacterium]
DVSVVRKSRRAQVGADPAYMPIPADLAVEVLSPNDRVRDIEDKLKDYLSAGFALVWIVNPYGRYVQIYRPGAGVQIIDEHGEITAEPALSQFRCRVAEFFNI